MEKYRKIGIMFLLSAAWSSIYIVLPMFYDLGNIPDILKFIFLPILIGTISFRLLNGAITYGVMTPLFAIGVFYFYYLIRVDAEGKGWILIFSMAAAGSYFVGWIGMKFFSIWRRDK